LLDFLFGEGAMKIAVIGCGAMGGALAKHLSAQHALSLCDSNAALRAQLASQLAASECASLKDALREAEAVVLAVKPKDLAAVSREIAPELTAQQMVISVLAGTSLETLRKHLPRASLLRIMPNLALTCNRGVIGLVQESPLAGDWAQRAEGLLQGLGYVFWLPEEKLEALTSLAASGPAFILIMIEALIEGGIAMGFTSQDARELVLHTIEGTVALLRASGAHPAAIKWQIASPAGTTIAGMQEMEAAGVRAGIARALTAAYFQAKKMLLGGS
jgi:pyrroline-5-carboxylate reductase